MKPLNWYTRNDGVICAEPEGLEKSYYISLDSGKWCLAMVDCAGEFTESWHESEELARQVAFKNYSGIIERYI